jgi:N6-L-threonylcarbamoyladenine synthase
MLILGIESTCDETGAAIVRDGREVLSNVVASQVELHAIHRGVVPEIASRAHIENILPVLSQSLSRANVELNAIDAIAVAHRPGLVGSLLIGTTAAKTLAWTLGKPLIGVDHVHAHLYSVMLEEGSGFGVQGSEGRAAPNAEPRTLNPSANVFPAVGLVVSGGHTALYDIRSWTQVQLIGSTIDDAVGEAYDKVAAILGLEYPGGPVIDRMARRGNPGAVKLPRSLMGRESLDFSFSGLKTAVLYHVRGVPGRGDVPAELNEANIRDIAASFQQACVDTLLTKIRRAAARIGARSVIIGGGVSANRGLREAMKTFELPVHFPPMQFCTDNAAMSAGLAHPLLLAGKRSELDLDAITFSQFRP